MMSLIIFLLGLSQCFVLVISADWLEVQQGSSRKDYGTECDLQCGENAGCFCRDTGQTDGYGDGNRDGDVAGCGQGDTARDEGVAKCVCDDGYVGNGYNCTDINECDEGSHKCKHGACHNEIGTYTCTCKQGWVGEFCNEDIDECAEGTDNCHENANCYNSPGSYKCACKPGYLGDGKDKCNDIDECLCSSCHLNANCENTPGSYECKCKAGYVGDGRICDAICENCDPNASCVAGTCECNSGYFGSGTVCTSLPAFGCNQIDHRMLPLHFSYTGLCRFQTPYYHAGCSQQCSRVFGASSESGACIGPFDPYPSDAIVLPRFSNNPVKRSIAANQRPYERRMYYKLDCVCRVCEKEELDVAGN